MARGEQVAGMKGRDDIVPYPIEGQLALDSLDFRHEARRPNLIGLCEGLEPVDS